MKLFIFILVVHSTQGHKSSVNELEISVCKPIYVTTKIYRIRSNKNKYQEISGANAVKTAIK